MQHACDYCDITFKKLEHAQRHLRTHTLDRPYACSECQKTFARRDTLNRHARLHTRKPTEPGASSKGRKKRIKSSTVVLEVGQVKTNNSTTSTAVKNKVQVNSVSTSLPLTLPLINYFDQSNLNFESTTTPSFKSVTRPSTSDGVVRSSTSMDYEPIPPTAVISRRHSFLDSNIERSTLPLLQAINHDRRSSAVANYGKNAYGMAESSTRSGEDEESNSSDGDDSNDGSYHNSIELESQYPSPAFTSYSPTSVLPDSMIDLEAILANDPQHSNNSHQQQQQQQHPHRINSDSFDLEFIHSLEGPPPKSLTAPYIVDSPKETLPSPSPLTHQQLLLLQQQQLSQHLSTLEQLEKDREQMPTPRSTHSQTIPLHQQDFFDNYDFTTRLIDEDKFRRQRATQEALSQQIQLQQQALQQRTLLHHHQHHAQQQHQQLQQHQLMSLTSLQSITPTLSAPLKPHNPHSRSRSSTLPSLTMPSFSPTSISPNDLSNEIIPRSRSNTLNSIFPSQIQQIPTYPSQSLSSAYVAASFPSLLLQQHVPLIGNGLGLVSSPEQILFDAYQRRKSLALSNNGGGGGVASVASSTTSNGSSIDTVNSNSMDFFTTTNTSTSTFTVGEKMRGLECGSGGFSSNDQWGEEELKKEGINWLLL